MPVRAMASHAKWDFLENLDVPAPQFVSSLKSAYGSDKGKAGSKFQALSRGLTKALRYAPPPGPCTFVVQCVDALGAGAAQPSNNQGIGHLITRSLNELDGSFKSLEDVRYSKQLAGRMFKDAIDQVTAIDDRLLVRLVLVLGIDISDVAQAYSPAEDETRAKASIESFILKLVKKRSYNSAVSLLKHFDLQDCTAQDFLVTMVCDGQPDLAGQWAEYLGKESCCLLVQQCTNMEMYKVAYRLVKRYGLQDEFPDAFYLYRRSSLRKLTGKGLWDIAESIASEDRVLQEYLIMLALQRNQRTRALTLCETFQLKDLDLSSIETSDAEEVSCSYIHLEHVLEHDKVLWIDSAEELVRFVSNTVSDAEIVGIDAEWKPDRTKGAQPNKVSILQVATRQNVFVLDLLKIGNDCESRDCLNEFIKHIFDSSSILKLGYGIHNDFNRLAQSYPELDAFQSCTEFIDLECFPGDSRVPGGISGLAKSAMGSEMDKSIRMSNWNQRPLTMDQLHYAALDAAILLPLHEHLCLKHSLADQGRSLAKSWCFSNAKRSDTRPDAQPYRPEI